ncbi:IS4/Tn5 family transposase DNA-binding protein [Bradyrhizobium japonicum]|uniref:IS4/Tn5 family transposase DNA-binding protein n=1 Tax=Bradyrhizobium japonicum TaxID=375 RepID=UPI00351370F1
MGLVKERAVARAQRLTTGIETWVDREVAGCEFKDERLGRRFCKLLAQIGSDMGQSIPLVCQDWANTKAAYRFFSNERVDEADMRSFRGDARARSGEGGTDPRPP